MGVCVGQEITAEIRKELLIKGRAWAESMRERNRLKRGNNDGLASFLHCLEDLMDDFTLFPSPDPWVDAGDAIRNVLSKCGTGGEAK